MEAAILGLLMLGGYHIQDNLSESDKIEHNDRKKTFSKKNIYQSNIVNESRNHIQQIGNNNMRKSLDPSNSNIIPSNYNLNTMEMQKRQLMNQSRRDNEQYIKSLERFENVNKEDFLLNKNQQKNEDNMIKEYFQNVNSANKNNNMFDSEQVLNNEDSNNIMMTNNFESVFDDSNITPSQKSHNNMVPFFGSNITQNTDMTRYNANKLETNTGSRFYKMKREKLAAPPQKDISHINGAPVSRDNDRFIQSSYKPFQTPIESIKVGPGLDKGYCASGTDGFHNMYRTSEKTVDDLRTDNNKKVSYTPKIQAGKQINDNRALPQTLNKNRPDTYYEQSSDNLFRTTGSRLKETLHPMIKVNPKKSEGTNEYMGGIGRNPKSKLSHNSSYHTEPTKNEQKAHPPSNVQGSVKRGNNNLKSYIAKTTIRQTTEDNNYTGNLSSHTKHTVGPEDQFKTTTRQTTQHNSHNGNLSSSSKVYASYEDEAKTTIRQLTQFNEHTGTLTGSNKPTTGPEDEFRTTGRQTTQFNEHTGTLTGSNMPTAGPEDEFRTTARQTTQFNEHTGTLTGSNMPTAGPEDEFRTTARQTTQFNEHTGTLTGSNKPTAGPEDEFRTTGRQTTQFNEHTGTLTGSNMPITGPEDEFRTTIRQITEINNHTGTLTGKTKQTIKSLDDLKATMKQLTVEYTRDGNIKGINKSKLGLQDEIKRTQKEQLSNNEYIGDAKGQNKATAILQDKMRATQKEQTSDYEYIGDAKGQNKATAILQDEVRATQKQETSDYEYMGDAKGQNKYMSRLAHENAETNDKREIISQGRGNAKQGSKTSVDPSNYNMSFNRQEYDNCRGHQQRFNRIISSNSSAEQQGQFMFSGNKLENKSDERIDSSLYDAYRMNELTIRKI